MTCSAPSATLTGTSAASSTLTVTTTAATPASNYTATVTGSDAATGKVTSSTPVTITINVPPSFGLTNGSGITETVGSSGTTALTLTPSGGFTGQVIVACAVSGSPTGLTCSAPPATVTGTSAATSTLTVTTTAATPASNYAATVTGSDAATGKITSAPPSRLSSTSLPALV